MSSVGKLVLLDETGLAANITSDKKSLEAIMVDLICVAELSNNAAGNFDCVVEHSPDGENWATLATIPTISANGFQKIDVSIFALPNVRANVTRNAGSGDLKVSVYYDKRK